MRNAFVRMLVYIIGIFAQFERAQISEYTNSQTPFADKDLKSVDRVQIDLEKYLKEHGINYIRKSGKIKMLKILTEKLH